MADNPSQDEDAADVLRRADALLRKHRNVASPPASETADIPTLTDIVIEGEVLPRTEPQKKPEAEKTPGGEVVSRVQAQNIEHAVYLKLKRSLDDQIAGVVRDRYLPEIGAALEQALSASPTWYAPRWRKPCRPSCGSCRRRRRMPHSPPV